MKNTFNLKAGQKITKDKALELCLDLAALGLGLAEPNPCVGAVLIKESTNKDIGSVETGDEECELVSWGYHQKYGSHHAEVNCLKDIKSAKGLTLIVSLEPCSHFGKTPPCADLVVEKAVSKLIYIKEDPNPLVSGKGLDKIKSAGIEVVKADEVYQLKHDRLNAKFLCAFNEKRSYVHLKWAESKDHKLSISGQRSTITGSEAQLDSHFLRAQSQMVVVGLNTVLLDDPKLDVRLKGYEKKLCVAVIDPELKLLEIDPETKKTKLETLNIQKLRGKAEVFLISPLTSDSLNVLAVPNLKDGKQIDLSLLVKKTYKDLKIQSLFVEGGANTLKSFIDQGIYDRVSVYKSNEVLSRREGERTVEVFKENGDREVFFKRTLELTAKETIGKDWLFDYIKK